MAAAGATTGMIARRFGLSEVEVGIITGRLQPRAHRFRDPFPEMNAVATEREAREQERATKAAIHRRLRALRPWDLMRLTDLQRMAYVAKVCGLGVRSLAKVAGRSHVAIWRAQRRAEERLQGAEVRRCPTCGTVLDPQRRRDAVFCSDACKERARRHRGP